jgi:hypothetical protein
MADLAENVLRETPGKKPVVILRLALEAVRRNDEPRWMSQHVTTCTGVN